MRKQMMMFLASFGVLVALAAAPAQAQSKETIRIEIPFEFTVGGETLRPGVYVIERLDPTLPNALRIKSAEGGPGKSILTQRVAGRGIEEHAKLLFLRYGEQYYLSEVWMDGALNGRRLPLGKGASELRRQEGKIEIVALLAKGKTARRR